MHQVFECTLVVCRHQAHIFRVTIRVFTNLTSQLILVADTGVLVKLRGILI